MKKTTTHAQQPGLRTSTMMHNQKTGYTLQIQSESQYHEDNPIQIFTEGSYSAQGVGAGIDIYLKNELMLQRRLTLHSNCSNNQAEQLAIVKAMVTIKNYTLQITSHEK